MESDPLRLRRIETAYRFFTTCALSDPSERTSRAGPEAANPYALKLNGVHTGLCAWMQCISYDHDVRAGWLGVGETVRKFIRHGVVAKRTLERGQHFVTDLRTPHTKLAVYPDQHQETRYRVVSPSPALWSTAGDNYVDHRLHARPNDGKTYRQNIDYFYRGGGGTQIFVPQPDIALEIDVPVRA
jgi:hypothetical protein